MWVVVDMVVKFILCMATLCVASYHEQYRVPQTHTDKWESFIFEDKEYVIQNLPISWENAKIMCRGHHNGTLAILDTKEKAEFMAEALAESQFELDSVWVGARRHGGDDPHGYRWSNLVELRRTAEDIRREGSDQDQYPAWQNRTHVPVPDTGADCVAVQRVTHDRAVFLDLPCELERPFLCEREARTEYTIKELNTVRCRTGLYRLYDGHLDWHQAAAYCVLRKMSLANIATMKCLKKLGKTMLKTRPSIENAWVGAKGELGKWQWVDSGASIFLPSPHSDVSAAVWPPMRDRRTIKQNGCLQLDRHASHTPVFLEARCERKMQFICYQGSTEGAPALRAATTLPSDDLYYYVFVKQLLYWQHAYENCRNMNGSLAYPETPDIMIQLLLMMGEHKEEPIEHIWISGRLNMTKDITTDDIKYGWYNPMNNKAIPDPKNRLVGKYMAPWLDEEFSRDNSCLNLDRQDHLKGLIYGLPCDTPQYSICMIERNPRESENDIDLKQTVLKNQDVPAVVTTRTNPEVDAFVTPETPVDIIVAD